MTYEDVLEDRMRDADAGMYDEGEGCWACLDCQVSLDPDEQLPVYPLPLGYGDRADTLAEEDQELKAAREEFAEKLRYWREERGPSVVLPAGFRAAK